MTRPAPALEAVGEAVFRGYDRTAVNTQVLAVFDDSRAEVPSLAAGQTGFVALRETPFYLEAGGQVSDVGTITAPRRLGAGHGRGARRRSGRARTPSQVTEGTLRARDLVTAEVSVETRDATRRNHTATHLLHAALRQVLGPHVKQAGIARRARIGCGSTSSTSARSRASSGSRSRRSSTRGSSRTPPSPPK